MTASLVQSPKTTFAIFLKSDGTISVTKRLFRGEVLDANLFMDTRARQVYFIYQIAVGATTITQGEYNLVKKYPYIIVATKATAFGKLLTLNDPTIVRYLVGYTKEQPANIAGYFNQNNGW